MSKSLCGQSSSNHSPPMTRSRAQKLAKYDPNIVKKELNDELVTVKMEEPDPDDDPPVRPSLLGRRRSQRLLQNPLPNHLESSGNTVGNSEHCQAPIIRTGSIEKVVEVKLEPEDYEQNGRYNFRARNTNQNWRYAPTVPVRKPRKSIARRASKSPALEEACSSQRVTRAQTSVDAKCVVKQEELDYQDEDPEKEMLKTPDIKRDKQIPEIVTPVVNEKNTTRKSSEKAKEQQSCSTKTNRKTRDPIVPEPIEAPTLPTVREQIETRSVKTPREFRTNEDSLVEIFSHVQVDSTSTTSFSENRLPESSSSLTILADDTVLSQPTTSRFMRISDTGIQNDTTSPLSQRSKIIKGRLFVDVVPVPKKNNATNDRRNFGVSQRSLEPVTPKTHVAASSKTIEMNTTSRPKRVSFNLETSKNNVNPETSNGSKSSMRNVGPSEKTVERYTEKANFTLRPEVSTSINTVNNQITAGNCAEMLRSTNPQSSCKIPVGRHRVDHKMLNNKRTRTKTDLYGHSDASMSKRFVYLQVNKSKIRSKEVLMEEDEAVLPELRPFSDALEEPDRDECVWRCPSDDEPELPSLEEMTEIFNLINWQYDGVITMDGVLHGLMKNNYKVDRMLERIDYEIDRMPQPFKPFNYAQQILFNNFVNISKKKLPDNRRVFSEMQRKFLQEYHLGEIVNYYYRTKTRPFFKSLDETFDSSNELDARCQCPIFVNRVECKNCTQNCRKYVTDKTCGVCIYYERKFERERPPSSLWTDDELVVMETWNDMKLKTGGFDFSYCIVQDHMERERIAKLRARKLTFEEIELVEQTPFKDQKNPVRLLSPYKFNFVRRQAAIHDIERFSAKKYNDNEFNKILVNLNRFGWNSYKTAAAIGYSDVEVQCFLNRFMSINGTDERTAEDENATVMEIDEGTPEMPYPEAIGNDQNAMAMKEDEVIFVGEVKATYPEVAEETDFNNPRKRNLQDEPSTSSSDPIKKFRNLD